jgi:hypothetical protein
MGAAVGYNGVYYLIDTSIKLCVNFDVVWTAVFFFASK